MAGLPPPPLQDAQGSFGWLEWYRQLRDYLSTASSIPWNIIQFAGSKLTDIQTRLHGDLQSIQGGVPGERYHLDATQYANLATSYIPYSVVQDLQDWTGFLFPGDVLSTYDSTARTVTLTSPTVGQLFYYWDGTKKTLGDGTTWTSPAHAATVGGWFLSSVDGVTFTWSMLSWEFYQLPMAFVYYGTVDRFGLRETHGTMPWQDHQEFHETVGTYLHSGGDLSGYTLASTTPAFRRPTVSTTTIKDEDLETVNPALTSSLYTKVLLTGTGTNTFTVETADIVPLLSNNPYYNSFTIPNWTQTLMSNNSYMNVWLIAVPTHTDATSQKYRYLWLQGQENGTLVAMRAVNSSSVNLGGFLNLFTEFVFIQKIIIRYTGGNWQLQEVTKLTGTRINQSSVGGGYLSAVTTDTTLSGNGTGGSPLTVTKPLPTGVTTGDFLRFNATSGAWETAAEPLEAKGLVLTPMAAALMTAKGSVFYNSTDDTIQVCTSI